jgi:predicted flavoprotein YhiN
MKNFQIKIESLHKKAAMISCGGVKLDEINPKTMESNLSDRTGLYFAGELMECYGPTGGYNLQIAFSTGYLAGKSASIATLFR